MIICSLFGSEKVVKIISEKLKIPLGSIVIHAFPDAESLITIQTDVKNKTVILLAYLDRPDAKIVQLILAAETARSLGAKRIILVAPYLPYMRQDKQFHPGEGISSIYFAKLISQYFDNLITVDPHLHRWHALSQIYSIDTKVLHAAAEIATWISKNIPNPVLLGPDGESAQWVSDIAKKLQAPYLVLSKERFGDQQVSSNMPELANYHQLHFVLIDDIVSTAATMIEAVTHLKQQGIQSVSCVAVHAIFSNNAYQNLLATGVTNIVSCNTVEHISNQIDLSDILVAALQDCFLRATD